MKAYFLTTEIKDSSNSSQEERYYMNLHILFLNVDILFLFHRGIYIVTPMMILILQVMEDHNNIIFNPVHSSCGIADELRVLSRS